MPRANASETVAEVLKALVECGSQISPRELATRYWSRWGKLTQRPGQSQAQRDYCSVLLAQMVRVLDM